MKFGKIYLLAVLLVCVVFVTGCLGGGSTNNDANNSVSDTGSGGLIVLDRTYTNDVYHFSFQHPKSWAVMDCNGPDDHSCSSSTAYVIIDSESDPMKGGFSMIIDVGYDSTKQLVNNVVDTDEGSLVINGIEAHYWEYTHEVSGGVTLKSKEILVDRNEFPYTLKFSSKPNDFNNFEKYFDDIVASFRFTN